MYLAESTNTADVSSLLEAETHRLDELRASGVLLAGWVKSDFSGAFLLLNCEDEESAAATLNSLPIAAAGATTVVTTAVVNLAPVPA